MEELHNTSKDQSKGSSQSGGWTKELGTKTSDPGEGKKRRHSQLPSANITIDA